MLCRELGELTEAADAVITCGGVGPTVDDCTIEAVAVAAGTRVATHQAFEAALRNYFGDAVRAPPAGPPPVQRLVVHPALCHAIVCPCSLCTAAPPCWSPDAQVSPPCRVRLMRDMRQLWS